MMMSILAMLLFLLLPLAGIAANRFEPTAAQATTTTTVTADKTIVLMEKILAALEALENNVRPLLPVWFSRAITIIALLWGLGPRVAVAWDRAVQKAEHYGGNNPLGLGWPKLSRMLTMS
jgi:hypothetical protein